MSQITLNLTDEATAGYAQFYGWDAKSDQSADDFVTDRLLTVVANDLIEKRNRDAIEAAQSKPLPDITTDDSMPTDSAGAD